MPAAIGILRDAIADDDKAAQMAEEAKKQVDEAHAEVEKVKKAEKRYEAQAKEAAAVEKVAQDAKAHADALSRQRAAELAVLQEEARARAKGKAKLLLELSKVESARRAVAAALAEAHNATRVAAQEVTDAGEKKKQVAQEMHDVAEHLICTSAAVAAAANADARLQNAEEELMKLQGIKVGCLQGTVHGSITVFVRYSEPCGMVQLAQLCRVERWVLHPAGLRSVVAYAWSLVVGELLPAAMTDCTRHVCLHWDGLSNSALRLLPDTCLARWMKRVVIEVSEMACDLAPGVIWAA
ncbi:unnamed protein product [Symbiodinium natans]|uniref:Uncharacterized protein n=1 Tax=Symbiodinium natans TaxID=878477 RepID=A0A812TSA3_9DINO|nr:unnamed protein product [Symbiodinium natans]